MVRIVVVAIFLASSAHAQSTGSSFGGGSWGSSSGSSGSTSGWSGSSGSSSWGSSSSSWGSSGSSGTSSWGSGSTTWGSSSGTTWGSSDSTVDDYGGGYDDTTYGDTYDGGGSSGGSLSYRPSRSRGSFGWFLGFFAFAVVIMFFVMASKDQRRAPLYMPSVSVEPRVDVSVIMVAIDWRARAFVQSRLAELATKDTSSNAALVQLLQGTVKTLCDVRLAWLYGGAYNMAPLPAQRAQAEFLRIAGDLRSRFRHELVRNVDGEATTIAAPSLTPTEEEGRGVVVVSLLVAAKHGLPDLHTPSDAAMLTRTLENFSRLNPFQLVAMEVVWSPAAEDDRMSTAELEVIYSELRRIEERTIGGRVFCGYCGAPHADELDRCPHCGAPRANAPPSPPV
ncbi:MAG: DUF1517 domain-containing protein [Myxococcota bacterium]